MILSTRSGNREVRVASLNGLADILDAAGIGRRSAGGTLVTPRTLGALPAAAACIRVASWAVASTPIAVWRGQGPERRRVTSSWQARYFAGAPNDLDSWFLLLEMTEASLTSRNNAYWLKLWGPDGLERTQVMHPDSVDAKLDPTTGQRLYRFRVRTPQGQGAWSTWIGQQATKETPASVLHFRVGYPDPGCVVAPSPVKLYADAIGAAAARARFESSLYEDGVLQSLAVTFPESVSEDQADRWRKVFQAEHGGIENRPKVRVFGGGASVSTIGLSLADTQFIESMAFSAEDMARILGVQASLIGVQKSDKPISPEHEDDRWRRHGLEPRFARIEQTIGRDPELFGPGSRDYPAFAVKPVRGDAATESRMLVEEVQAGILLADEARAQKGMTPLPPVPKDPLKEPGKVPQVTPVGGAPNPNVSAPADGDDDEEE